MPILSSTFRSYFLAASPTAVLYAFASKERDTETGLSYFGARYYYSDLSIWLSVDPMVDKYPSFSPYVYCANNPVKLVDPNGEDYEVIKNDNEKTLTIRATYYASNERDLNQLQKGLDAWNSQSGGYELQMDDGDRYTINFELTGVLDVEKFNDASRESNEVRGANCNAFKISDNYWGYEDGDRGTTRNGHVCYVKSDAPFRTTVHEIGHTLGLGEFSGDNVMTQGGEKVNITKIHVKSVLEHAGIRCSGTFSGGSQISNPNATAERTYKDFTGKLRSK